MPESMCRDRGSYGGPDPLFTCPQQWLLASLVVPDFFWNSLGCSASHLVPLGWLVVFVQPTIVLSPSLTLGLSLSTQAP